jgi:hypothetical protein
LTSARTTARPAPAGSGVATAAAPRRLSLPWRAVVLPWAVSRLVAAVGLALLGAKPLGSVDLDALADWDVGWFQSIVQVWYGPAELPAEWAKGAWTSWPFFPLHPVLARGVSLLGVSDRVALIVVNNLAFLAALWGLHRLASRHLGARAAVTAVWAMALFPGSITLVMGYSGGLFAAGAVWAFVLLEERRPVAAGLALAVAASARPNGFLLLAALAPAAFLFARSRRESWVRPVVAVAAPTLAFMVAWSWWCWSVTGDALVYLNAKAAWEEVSLLQFLKHPLAGNSTVHVFLGVIAVGVLALQARRIPWLWHVFVVVMIAPPLVLGVTGIGRYAAESFPVFIAVGGLLDRLPRWMRPAYFVASAVGLLLFGMMVNRWRYVP